MIYRNTEACEQHNCLHSFERILNCKWVLFLTFPPATPNGLAEQVNYASSMRDCPFMISISIAKPEWESHFLVTDYAARQRLVPWEAIMDVGSWHNLSVYNFNYKLGELCQLTKAIIQRSMWYNNRWWKSNQSQMA